MSANTRAILSEAITLPALDGYPLTATLESGQGAAYAGATHVRIGSAIFGARS